MALNFGPQWLRDLSDAGSGAPGSPTTPTGSVKFKLADYRYGREEMLSLFTESSPPPDQVRKHLTIFSKEIQKPITMMPFTEDEQRLTSAGYNSTHVLRAAGRSSGPPPRVARGGGSMDRGRGRGDVYGYNGRGRGEGYIPRTMENGEVGYSRSSQDGWEQVGRKFERSFSGGAYEEGSSNKREFPRSSRDNWRDKREEASEEDNSEGGVQAGWRGGPRWNSGPAGASRNNWRDSRDGGYEVDRRHPSQGRRGFDHEPRGPRRISESADNDEVPEWVDDDMEDDPGSFDSKGVFVSTKESRSKDGRYEPPHHKHKNSDSNQTGPDENVKKIERVPTSNSNKQTYVPPHKQQNGLSTVKEKPSEQPPSQVNEEKDRQDSTESTKTDKTKDTDSQRGRPDSIDIQNVTNPPNFSQKGEGDSGFAFPTKVSDGTKAPPGQYYLERGEGEMPELVQKESEDIRHPEPDAFSLADKSLQNLVAEMTAEAEQKAGNEDVSKALPLNHENAHKWFYRDPQGEIQGPFSNDDMGSWFSAGYFTMSLIVKRGCDDSFKQLGELIKRYGRVPFLPGPPLPPLVTSSVAPEIPSPVPPLISPIAAMPALVPGMQDPNMYRQLLMQQEYLKQTILLRQLHMQNLQQLQETDSFKGLNPEQQQHLAMQMTMQTNPVTMQHIHNLQQQQLLSQHKLTEQHRTASPPTSTDPPVSLNNIPLSGEMSLNPSAELDDESAALWGMPASQPSSSGSWSQPTNSLWDVSHGNEGLGPAYQNQLDKLMKEREENLLKEERAKQERLEKEKEELRRQQEALEQEREKIRREKEELERQNLLEIKKLEEARKREEERLIQQEQERLRRQEEEKRRMMQELEKEKKRLEEEKRRKEEERKRLEEEKRIQEEMKRLEEEERKRREKEQLLLLQKQEEKRRQENNKKKQAEEQKRLMEELRKKDEQRLQQEEAIRLQEQKRKEEERLRNDAAERERLRQEAEYERMQQDEQREQDELYNRQQAEILRQQEALHRLKQAQQAQLANIKLPKTSNWAANQANQPKESRSLMEIQAEEARKEKEMELEKQIQMQQMQEHTIIMAQQNQPKSWSTRASQGVPKGPSLLDIQRQEQENFRKSNKKENNPNSFTAKLSAGSNWSTPLPAQPATWTTSVWDSSAAPSATIWDQPLPSHRSSVAASSPSKKSVIKESGEFPALRNSTQTGGTKSQKKTTKSKNKKTEEEQVKNLFQQNRKQDSFSDWVAQRVSQFSANVDVPTFVSFIVDVDNPEDIKEYMKMYLGDSRESVDFARQFIEKRSKFRNQARLEKQQEEDSIWGPAAAVNPYNRSQSAVNQENEATSKSKKNKKKQKMQKLDVSALGFTVHSDPNRKNAAGELESVQ